MAEVGGMLAAAVLKAAAGKVGDAVGERMLLRWKLHEDLEDMRDTVESIEAVMEDAEMRSIKDASVRLWLKRLTRASYGISDMFDEFELKTTTKSSPLPKVKFLKPCFTLAPEVAMADKMKKMREKLENISNHHHKFSFTAGSSSTMQQDIDGRVTSWEVIEADIIGRDEEKKDVITLLEKESISQDIIILPIYGIGGIGKTTLAQLVYGDNHFKDYDKVWVYVSQTFDLDKIKDSITKELEKQSRPSDSQDPDACKKILIVLDDIWEDNQSELDKLMDLLKRVRDGRKLHVVVTTRDAGIAEIMKTTKEAHKIASLSDHTCWTIMEHIVAFQDGDDKKGMEVIGKEIAKKCGGVALAARALGYMLRSKNYDGWKSVESSDIWNVSRNMSRYAPSPSHNLLASLKLSYSSMLPYVRLCFAYGAVFPKGHKIAKDDLIQQWEALDFFKPTEEGSTWDHGDYCIKQLLGMSFLQHSKSPNSLSPSSDGQHDQDGTLFIMHDLVHDLARSVMADEVLDTSKLVSNIGGSNYRYVLLADCEKPLDSFLTSPDKIRAIRFLEGKTILRDIAFSTAKYLRVLDLKECSIEKLPPSIGQLKLLRYLNAPRIKDVMIPKFITKLSRLIYLNLSGSSAILSVSDSIGEMESLMYLDLSGCSGIEKMPESLRELNKMVHLDLSNCSNVTGVSESLGSLTQLHYLNLSHCKNIGGAEKSLGDLTQLHYLNLSFSSYHIGSSEAEFLGKLTKLRYLNLSSKGNQILKSLPEALGRCIELKYLNLSGCECLEGLPGSFGKLINLVHLDLSNCWRVNGFLEALHTLTKLQYLNLSKCFKFKIVNAECGSVIPLPQVMEKLRELRYLNLSECLDSIVPSIFLSDAKCLADNVLPIISTLSNLEHLDLSNNESVYAIPESFSSLTKLHTLDLSGCRSLRTLPDGIENIGSLKFVMVQGCNDLDMSTQSRFDKISVLLPNFKVHAIEGKPTSNLDQLKDLSPLVLNISCLENVKSVEEAQRIKLVEKEKIIELKLEWEREKEECLEEMKLLKELKPPDSLQKFELQGYNAVSFPDWLMTIATYLPKLVTVKLVGLSQCSSLPPLGQLPFLKVLVLEEMPMVTKIDGEFCGGMNAFSELIELSILKMENLEEWSTTYSYGQGVENKPFMFPNLEILDIKCCRKLRLNPCPPRVKRTWHIADDSDGVLSQWRNNLSQSAPSTSSASMRHLSFLEYLKLTNCSSIQALPEWLGELTSLKELEIDGCNGIMSLPESIQKLANLSKVTIHCCPALARWCKSEKENMDCDLQRALSISN